MAAPASYKPSPLGYGSPRSSPFRRPESPASSPFRATTPSASPTKAGQVNAGSRFADSSTTTPTAESRTTRGLDPALSVHSAPQRNTAPVAAHKSMGSNGNALSQLQPTQVRTLREGFQILDRDSDGVVNREDVADMLTQLGLPASQSDVSRFFPPSAAQTMTLAAFLNSVATSLAALSPSAELLSAFSAFDDDDSGQVDLAELRDALLHTAPEPGERPLAAAEVDKVMEGFTGRRAFSKSKSAMLGKRGEVFKYQDFVSSIAGKNGGGAEQQGSAEEAEEA